MICSLSDIEQKACEYFETVGVEADLCLMAPDVFADFNKSLGGNAIGNKYTAGGVHVTRMHTSLGTVDLRVVQGWPPGTWKVCRTGQENTNIEKILFDKVTKEFEELVFKDEEVL